MNQTLHFKPADGQCLSSAEIAEVLDCWIERNWHLQRQILRRRKMSVVADLASLAPLRAALLQGRETARRLIIRELRASGRKVADDFGLPCQALTLEPRTPCAPGEV